MRARNYVLIVKLLSSNRSSGTLAMKGERHRNTTQKRYGILTGHYNSVTYIILYCKTTHMTKCLHADPKYPPETYDKTPEKGSGKHSKAVCY
jgi:hypothetical protein